MRWAAWDWVAWWTSWQTCRQGQGGGAQERRRLLPALCSVELLAHAPRWPLFDPF